MYTEEAKQKILEHADQLAQEIEECMAGIYEALRSLSVSLDIVDERLTSIEHLVAELKSGEE